MMQLTLNFNGMPMPLFIKMRNSHHGLLMDAFGKEFLSFIVKDDIVVLESPNVFGESDAEICNAIESVRFKMLQQNYDGIEEELIHDEESSDETYPFDPDDISIDTKPVTMETLLRRLEQNTIQLNPDFQRQEVWDDIRKSRLIESLLLNIPIPMFYVSSDEKGNWSVVDGLQRITTFRDFVLGKKFIKDPTKYQNEKGNGMALTGLEFRKSLNGLTMNKLPRHLYNRILETVFTFTIVNPGTHEEVKRNIFKRLNTGGLPLSSQEIRNALYTGKSTLLLNELAQTKEFKAATSNSIHAQRMEDRELILRYIAFMIRRPITYKRTLSIDTWLSDTMIILNSMPEFTSREFLKCIQQRTVQMQDIEIIDEDLIKESFLLAMRRAKKLFGKHAFRKSTGDMRRRPINKSLFEIWSVLLSDISELEFAKLYKNRNKMLEEYREILDEPNFEIAISRDSMKHASVSMRYEKLSNLVNKFSVEG